MRIVENALSISAAFLSFSFSLFFSLPPPRGLNLIFPLWRLSVSPAIFLFFERRGLLSSRLFQGDEIFILFFSISSAHHTSKQSKKVCFVSDARK